MVGPTGFLPSGGEGGRIQRVFRGAYVDFTGPVPWEAKVWAAWLAYGPAARSAGDGPRQLGLDGDWPDDVVQIDVPHSRRVSGQSGIEIRRSRDYDTRLFGSRQPPIVRLEVAVLTVASRQNRPDRALAVVLEACRQRRTTPARLLEELRAMPCLPGRSVLLQALEDATNGVQSFLESAYLHQVEKGHGLPTGRRQVRGSTGWEGGTGGAGGSTIYRDVEYDPYGLVVELDGRIGHDDTRSTWRDMTRDNAAVLEEKQTLRFGYQLIGRPCEAAGQVAKALRSRGWSGTPTPCTPTCPIAASG